MITRKVPYCCPVCGVMGENKNPNILDILNLNKHE